MHNHNCQNSQKCDVNAKAAIIVIALKMLGMDNDVTTRAALRFVASCMTSPELAKDPAKCSPEEYKAAHDRIDKEIEFALLDSSDAVSV